MATWTIGGGCVWDASDHTSEREAGDWEDCTPCSLVMVRRASEGASPATPSTIKEAEALRALQGDQSSGVSISELRTAYAKRYHSDFTYATPSDIASVLKPGRAVAATGSWKEFPAKHKFRRWDDYAGGHAVCFLCLADGRYVLDDPLAPEGAGYSGDLITLSEIRQFYDAWPYKQVGWVVAGSVGAADVAGLIYDLGRWKVPAGAPFYEDWKCTRKVGSMGADAVVTSIGMACTKDDADGIYYGSRLVLLVTGAVTGKSARKAFWMPRPAVLSDAAVVPTATEWDNAGWAFLGDPAARYPCPPVDGDCSAEIAVDRAKARVVVDDVLGTLKVEWP